MAIGDTARTAPPTPDNSDWRRLPVLLATLGHEVLHITIGKFEAGLRMAWPSAMSPRLIPDHPQHGAEHTGPKAKQAGIYPKKGEA
mmetsp:Transcript_101581/g.327577  ORF Transcript_101581/g.327577 Transcript_101581/m.327577 type:complete len:86 (-) Transcript_101581:7-264(-)